MAPLRSFPLSSVRVLDLSRVLAGPWCTQLLSDFGAAVYKIEHPVRGDDTRGWGPPFYPHNKQSAYFVGANRNKKSVTVDFSSTDGAALVREMSRHCDVVVENFRPGTLAKYGLDYQSMRAVNPNVVYASITGFGQSDGPRRDESGFDFMIQAMGGLMAQTGPPGPAGQGECYKAGVAITDIMTGLYCCNAITAALVAGKTAHVDASLFDTQIAGMANIAATFLASHEVPRKPGNAHVNIAPYSAYRTQDQPVVICVGNDHQFQKLVSVIEGRLADRPSQEHRTLASSLRSETFATNALRVTNQQLLDELLNKSLATQPRSVWIADLNAQGVPVSPINTIGQALEDPQSRHRELAVQYPDGTRAVGCAVRYSEDSDIQTVPSSSASSPPILGQHTAEVLVQELGLLSPAAFDDYRQKGIV